MFVQQFPASANGTELADRLKISAWELEFADGLLTGVVLIFILGNPPWIRRWNEQRII